MRSLLRRIHSCAVPTMLCVSHTPIQLHSTITATATSGEMTQQTLLATGSKGQHPNVTSTSISASSPAPAIEIPEPKYRHIVLPPPPKPPALTEEQPAVPVVSMEQRQQSGILVIGDVHGCYDEMILLYNKAVVANNNRLFYYVILVGDICNKGPQSMQVIRHMQQQENEITNATRWICIRGNHENAVLRAYIELKLVTTTAAAAAPSSSSDIDVEKKKSRYRWLLGEELIENGDTAAEKKYIDDDDDVKKMNTKTQHQILHFTDDDYKWMSNLPYTIRIPANHVGFNNIQNDDDFESSTTNSNDDIGEDNNTDYRKHDTIIVHAGLIPGIPIEENEISTMVTLREVSIPDNDNNSNDSDGTTKMKSVPWASVWDGPESIIFGHDAKRGLQKYSAIDHNECTGTGTTIGIDTGCVYGNQLTGILLPSRTLVQVNAMKQHVPIDDK